MTSESCGASTDIYVCVAVSGQIHRHVFGNMIMTSRGDRRWRVMLDQVLTLCMHACMFCHLSLSDAMFDAAAVKLPMLHVDVPSARPKR